MTKAGKNLKKKHLKKKKAVEKRTQAALFALAQKHAKKVQKRKGLSSPANGSPAPPQAGVDSAAAASQRAEGADGSANAGSASQAVAITEPPLPSERCIDGLPPPGTRITKSMLPLPRSSKLDEEEFLRQKKLRKKMRAKMKKQENKERAEYLAENPPPPPKEKREKHWRKKEREARALKAGDLFPDLGEFETDESTPDAKKTVNLSSILETQGVVLFVHVRADASGCTKQAQFFEKEQLVFEGRNFALFGLSASQPKKTEYWKRKKKIGLTFLSDPFRLRLKKLGVTMGSKGVQRSVFVVDKGGIVKFAKVKINPQLSIKHAIQAVRANPPRRRVQEPLVPVP